jgi:hypothetical protein
MTNPQAPGADELRIRQLLIKQGVGADAEPTPVIPPKPTARPRDWLDELLDDNATTPEPAPEAAEETAPEPEPAAPETPAARKKPKVKTQKRRRKRAKRHDPHAPRSAWDSQPESPRQSLLDAWAGIPYRLKWLAAHLTAAAIGWRLGLVDWATDTAAWYAAGHWTNGSAWVLYVFAGIVAALYRMGRGWAWLFRLLASVPIASVVIGVLLYGTGYHR